MLSRRPPNAGDEQGRRSAGVPRAPHLTGPAVADAGETAGGGRIDMGLLPTVVMLLIPAIAVGAVLGGCSCRRRPEWDSGLERRDRLGENPGTGTAGGGTGAAAQGDADAGSGAGQGGGSGAGGSAGGGAEGAGDGGAGGGRAGDGDRDSNGAGAAAGGAPTDGGEPGAGSTATGKPVAGLADGPAAGVGNAVTEPPAALPGKPRVKPKFDAPTAAGVAQRELRNAESRQARGDFGAAYEAALEAFEAVAPHASADAACGTLVTRAKQLLAELAEKQNRRHPPRDVPTFFE